MDIGEFFKGSLGIPSFFSVKLAEGSVVIQGLAPPAFLFES